ncbi:MAG: hypothetical protein AUJ34_00125 [Parcubacteria group bacterium CG1_02_41_12]|nr:MAG: hypothetical protein AUJ34_00125 [Parcubacteria group bacterium CG1_02_41_12]PIQ79152.1 MAG: hypothetical protein COV79_04235 [Parcubacteria group bacterium CG11_big_fil_rev_8_21_14_0_20_41_14]
MVIQDLLHNSEHALNHLLSSSLDSEVILSFVIDKPREYILANMDKDITADKTAKFEGLIARRAKHEPVAYLIHNKEFYERNFYVDNRVHIPRPATEDLIDCVKQSILKRSATLNSGLGPLQIADIGTGSGCIAITLALEFPNAKIIATDISDDALEVAKRNADKLGSSDKITFLKGDLLSVLAKPVDIIVSNPPYGWIISPPVFRACPEYSEGGRLRGGSSVKIWTNDKEVFFQPKESYESGQDGLTHIKKLIKDLPNHLKKNGKCFLEFDPRQTESIKQIAKDNNYNITIKKDFASFDRIAILQ